MNMVTVEDVESIRHFYSHFGEQMPVGLDEALKNVVSTNFSVSAMEATKLELCKEFLSGKAIFNDPLYDHLKIEARKVVV